jgi:hypothetical protein
MRHPSDAVKLFRHCEEFYYFEVQVPIVFLLRSGSRYVVGDISTVCASF